MATCCVHSHHNQYNDWNICVICIGVEFIGDAECIAVIEITSDILHCCCSPYTICQCWRAFDSVVWVCAIAECIGFPMQYKLTQHSLNIERNSYYCRHHICCSFSNTLIEHATECQICLHLYFYCYKNEKNKHSHSTAILYCFITTKILPFSTSVDHCFFRTAICAPHNVELNDSQALATRKKYLAFSESREMKWERSRYAYLCVRWVRRL